MKAVLALALVAVTNGCAGVAQHTVYTGVPLPVGNTGVCAMAIVELQGEAACQRIAITHVDLEQRECPR